MRELKAGAEVLDLESGKAGIIESIATVHFNGHSWFLVRILGPAGSLWFVEEPNGFPKLKLLEPVAPPNEWEGHLELA